MLRVCPFKLSQWRGSPQERGTNLGPNPIDAGDMHNEAVECTAHKDTRRFAALWALVTTRKILYGSNY